MWLVGRNINLDFPVPNHRSHFYYLLSQISCLKSNFSYLTSQISTLLIVAEPF